MIFFCIYMLRTMGNDTEHIPNTNTNDDHCPSEAHRDDRLRPRTARALARANGVVIFQTIDARNSRRGQGKSPDVPPGTSRSFLFEVYKPGPRSSRSLSGRTRVLFTEANSKELPAIRIHVHVHVH